jgi:predicted nucleic acid-binding protein
MSLSSRTSPSLQTSLLFALLLPALACGDEPGTARPPREPVEEQLDPGDEPGPDPKPEPERVVAHGAFASPADQERFETEVLPSARAFLDYWAEAGLTVAHDTARIFVSPPPGARARRALPMLYGDAIFDELRALEDAVARAPTNEKAIEIIDAFTCAHPPLDRGFLSEIEEELGNPIVTPARIGEALKMEHAERFGEDATFSFHEDNGEFELPKSRACSYILVGYATDPTREHPFLEEDVINHELGHALHYGSWLRSGLPLGEALSSSANEAIADILAHVFDGDACHGKVLDANRKPIDCRRRMNGYQESVSDAVWSMGRGDHATGQALRDLVWTLREKVSAEVLRAAIVAGIAAIQPALATIDAEPLATAPVFDDEILAIRFRFMREYEASDAFHAALCAALGKSLAVCDEQEARIGDPRGEMRASWLAHAPTILGSEGITLEDGRHVAFEVDGPYLPAMLVTELDGVVTRYASSTALDRDQHGVVTLWFGETEQLGWTSNATLVPRTVSDFCAPFDAELCAELADICEATYVDGAFAGCVSRE